MKNDGMNTFSNMLNVQIKSLIDTCDKYKKSKHFQWYHKRAIDQTIDVILGGLDMYTDLARLCLNDAEKRSRKSFDTCMLDAENVDLGVYSLKRECKLTKNPEPRCWAASVLLSEYHEWELVQKNAEAYRTLVQAYKSSIDNTPNVLDDGKEFFAFRKSDKMTKKAIQFLQELDELNSSKNFVAREVAEYLNYVLSADMFSSITDRTNKAGEIDYTLGEYAQLEFVAESMDNGYSSVVDECKNMKENYSVDDEKIRSYLLLICEATKDKNVDRLKTLNKQLVSEHIARTVAELNK